jgi:hypothetical protein
MKRTNRTPACSHRTSVSHIGMRHRFMMLEYCPLMKPDFSPGEEPGAIAEEIQAYLGEEKTR